MARRAMRGCVRIGDHRFERLEGAGRHGIGGPGDFAHGIDADRLAIAQGARGDHHRHGFESGLPGLVGLGGGDGGLGLADVFLRHVDAEARQGQSDTKNSDLYRSHDLLLNA